MLNRKCTLTYIGIICLAIFSHQALAFGADGHRIISRIAENHLSDKTTQALKVMTEDADLSELSLWPDKIRGIPKWRKSKYWHYINISDHQQFDSPEFEALKRGPKGDLLSALNQFYQQLQNPELPKETRIQALSFFIHFVGDIHQPLHVGRQADRGGNSISVKWLKQNKRRNLHWVWDSGLLGVAKLSVEDYVARLDQASEKQIKLWQQDSFLDWAAESKMLRPQVYEFGLKTPPPTLKEKKSIPITQDYINRNKPIIEKRLLMAGIRLAGILNQIFDPRELEK